MCRAAGPGAEVCVRAGRGLERKNGWTLAEWAGEVSSDGMQRLLRTLIAWTCMLITEGSWP